MYTAAEAALQTTKSHCQILENAEENLGTS